MKRPTKNQKQTTRSSLWRNTLLGIIGLTMSACGLSADEPERESHNVLDVISAQADIASPTPTDKEEQIKALKQELEALKEKVAKVEAIEPPTLDVAKPIASAKPVALTTQPKPGQLDSHEVDGELGVVASAMALGVEKRVPLGVGSKFSADAEKIWAFIKVKNKNAPTKLRMVWKRHGKQRMAVDLRVGKSSGWRTWSYKRIAKQDAGKWTVDVLTQDGKTLHSMDFEVAPSSAKTDIAGK